MDQPDCLRDGALRTRDRSDDAPGDREFSGHDEEHRSGSHARGTNARVDSFRPAPGDDCGPGPDCCVEEERRGSIAHAETDDNTIALGGVRRLLDEIQAGIGRIEAREGLIDRLHTRLAKYEEDDHIRSFLEPLTRKIAPILRRVTDQHAQLERYQAKLPPHSRRRELARWARECLRGVHVDLETLLNDFGVEPFICRQDRFDRSRQQAIEHKPTPDTEQAGRVTRRIAPGYRIGDRIVIPERVAVYVHANSYHANPLHEQGVNE